MIALSLLFGLGAACLTSSDLNAHGITPAKRNMDKLTPAFFNWESARFTAGINKILLRDAMGYEFDTYEKFGGGGSMFDAMDDGTAKFDLVTEVWENSVVDKMVPYVITSNILTNYGGVGYTGTAGWYISEHTMSLPAVVNNNWEMEYYGTYLDNAVPTALAMNLTDFIVNDPTLSVDSSMPRHPHTTFSPPQCDTITCIDVILMEPGWEPNFWQSQVRNLNLPFRLTWWGYTPMTKLATALDAAGESFIFYTYIPDTLLSKVPGRSITFPKPFDSCLDGANMTNNEGLYSTIACEYPFTNLLKMARTEKLEHLAAEEAAKFMAQFQVQSSDVQFLFDTLANDYNWSASWDIENSDFEDIACKWIKAHPEKWINWIYNDYTYADTLSAEQIVMYCCASIICVLALVFLGWKLGFMDGLESVLFDMMLVYIGKIVMDLFDLMSDTISYFSAVNGNDKIALWYNVMYVMVVGASYVAGVFAIYQNFICAKDAFFTKQSVEKGEVNEQEMEKLRAKSSLWQGSRARPRMSDLKKKRTNSKRSGVKRNLISPRSVSGIAILHLQLL